MQLRSDGETFSSSPIQIFTMSSGMWQLVLRGAGVVTESRYPFTHSLAPMIFRLVPNKANNWVLSHGITPSYNINVTAEFSESAQSRSI